MCDGVVINCRLTAGTRMCTAAPYGALVNTARQKHEALVQPGRLNGTVRCDAELNFR